MTQEARAKPVPFMRAFDESRNISHHKRPVVSVADNAEMGRQSRKREIRNPRPGGRHAGQQGRFAGIRKSDQTHVGQYAQLKPQGPFLPRSSRLSLAGQAVSGRGKKRIPLAALSPPGNEDPAVGLGQIGQYLAVVSVTNERPGWHADNTVRGVASVLVLAAAVLAAGGPYMLAIAQVEQGAELRIDLENHTPAVAAVAAVRTASGAVLFAQEADTALAAVTRFDKNPNFINKAHTTKKAPCGASQKRGGRNRKRSHDAATVFVGGSTGYTLTRFRVFPIRSKRTVPSTLAKIV